MATVSKSVTVSDGGVYNLELNAILDGSTVTPVNDIQTWLNCANIWNKSYTTIAQVLADASTLQALIASNNAVNYMVRSTSWASSVCANGNAMTYIGANNYCANKLLANSTWLSAICNSTYFESVLNVKVPTMTSNTEPYGSVSATSNYSISTQPYKAFDGDDNTSWVPNVNHSVNAILYWHSTNPICAKRIKYRSDNGRPTSIEIQAYNDGGTYTTLGLFSPSGTGIQYFNLNNDNYYLHYCLIIRATSEDFPHVNTLQFYGRA